MTAAAPAPAPAPEPSTDAATPERDVRMTIWEHLEELRRRIIKAAIGVIVVTVVAWCFRVELLAWLVIPYQHTWLVKFNKPLVLQTLAPADAFLGYLELSLTAGIVGAAPVIFYQLWSFISPGLYRKEKRLIVPFVFFSTTLFLSGVAFAYYVAFPFTFNYFLSLLGEVRQGVELTQIVTLEFFLDFATRFLLVLRRRLRAAALHRVPRAREHRHAQAAPQVRAVGDGARVRSRRGRDARSRGDEPDRGQRRAHRALFPVDPDRLHAQAQGQGPRRSAEDVKPRTQPSPAHGRWGKKVSHPLSFHADDPRVRCLNDRPTNPRGEFVLYWMQVFRRAEDNAALAYAIERANELGVPCLVYEALRPDYPHASDRIHTFVLEGARDVAAGLEQRGVTHAFFLPRTPAEARGVVAKLAARSCAVVSDDFPSFVVPAHHAAAAKRAPCSYLVVDDCAVVPMALLAKPETAARTIRPKVLRALPDWLRPLAEPVPRVHRPARLELPFDPVKLARVDVGELVAGCAIDHAVPAVEETRGGTKEAEKRLRAFVKGRLATYAGDRNDPTRDATSGLSPYLHFGMISPQARRARGTRLGERGIGRGVPRTAPRATCARLQLRPHRPDHAHWSALPAWARATLQAHAGDARYVDLSLEDLEAARTPDALWNATMRELRARGTIQPYARMLWGKLPLTWMRRPEDAHAAVVHLNDRWALDGRDPDGYANVSWCFGLHDRPWPERAIFGTVRAMTSTSARKKLDFEDYIARWRR